MRNIALLLSYDGTNFHGWQRQQRHRSIQEEIEKGLGKLLGKSPPLTGSGRTDAGVHAKGQVANFLVDDEASIPSGRVSLALNSVLPADIRILESVEVGEAFHARRNARQRVYHYRLYSGPVLPAYWRNYCLRVSFPLNIATLNQLARPLVGLHDFTTFACQRRGNATSSVRHVYKAHFFKEGPFTVFEIAANGFLWKMVRSIIGTLLEIYEYPKTEGLAERLSQKNREKAGVTAPPQGLFLERVCYDLQEFSPPLSQRPNTPFPNQPRERFHG